MFKLFSKQKFNTTAPRKSYDKYLEKYNNYDKQINNINESIKISFKYSKGTKKELYDPILLLFEKLFVSHENARINFRAYNLLRHIDDEGFIEPREYDKKLFAYIDNERNSETSSQELYKKYDKFKVNQQIF